ncbi:MULTISPECIES: helix-turn-helix domain-containing protein [unclassified Chelatococcus]|uniref:helix-turn-helix domain-containing protein n=1 Tax=unclassified Chelatococcus TaxID=2638111 RepID=UPI001BCBB5EE|nr:MULTISPECIES: helix-turn-helix domain-containing protein [unclassified Chelatococcus]CAH1665534.1 putative phage repressor [Hyphomicrobiales bacterium]MBS7737734.1 helix-turn-helix domain-containing protein [Chelatococcus sp. HY11]MBX3547223.1 helix-turn-helix domain-containing protein [Chelatococcus sp.]MCO5077138.1 helix-turn-helix domain-containing protein [Chelatococcus sp.]CAH1681273.1 putative phage repressor [Hyphomicrobiales bacterium]
MTLADVVRRAREAKGMTQAQLAEAVGISQQAVGLIESGRTKAPTTSWKRIAAALDIPLQDLKTLMDQAKAEDGRIKGSHLTLASDSSSRVPAPNAGRAANLTPMGGVIRTIPVLGHAAGGAPGRGFIIMGDIIERVPCPPWLESVDGAYALYVDGESMVPRYFPGERVYIHPHKPPSPNDFVVAQVKRPGDFEPHGYIKQYKGWDRGMLILHQFNPDEDLEFDGDEVVALHKIVVPGLS